jgi:pimeloyl-ACP methyl ester carboxylesterase
MNITRAAHPTRLRVAMMAVILAIAALAISASQLPSAHATTAHAAGSGAPKPTIVLEHGSWADGSSWNAVIRRLQRAGYTVYAPPNPLRGLAYDSATLADFLKTISGPIVLAGHSYGGMVITNAATGNPNVKALVYDDAFIPAQGDTVFGLTAAQPGSCLGGDGFNPVPSPGSPATDPDIYLKVAPSGTYPGFDQCFANGVPAAQAAVLAATQRPSALNAGSDPSGVPAWKTIPSWAVVGTADHVIPLAEQLFMAHRAGAHITKINSGHLSLITHPGAVTRAIIAAANTTG